MIFQLAMVPPNPWLGNPKVEMQKIELVPPSNVSAVSIEQAIHKRRTCREYKNTPITIKVLSQLLWSAQGLTGGSNMRTTPSAGARCPLRIFVFAGNVSELPVGVYKYHAKDHELSQESNTDIRSLLSTAVIDEQPWVSKAAAVMVITADMMDMTEHFKGQSPIGERGARYVYMETGAAAQNVYLQSTALNIGVVLVGGFHDDKMKRLLSLPPGLEVTALLCLGKPSTNRKTVDSK